MKVSFSLANAKSKAKPVGEALTLKKPVAFASLEDDEPLDAAETAESSTRASANRKLVAQNVEMSKAMRRQLEEEKKVDSTLFEYDEVWDKMQETKLRQKADKEADAKERKVRRIQRHCSITMLTFSVQPKYISGLLTAAATRRLDHLRAEEKMIQREREAEGDEFAEKEQFVTQAYKDQMAEVRRAEEEEKKREGMSMR